MKIAENILKIFSDTSNFDLLVRLQVPVIFLILDYNFLMKSQKHDIKYFLYPHGNIQDLPSMRSLVHQVLVRPLKLKFNNSTETISDVFFRK